MTTQLEGRIEGDGYHVVWRRNDKAWGHAIDAEVFDPKGNPIGRVSFACHPEFADYELYQQMPTEELLHIVDEHLRAVMRDGSYAKGWGLGLQVITRFNGLEQSVPSIR